MDSTYQLSVQYQWQVNLFKEKIDLKMIPFYNNTEVIAQVKKL